jgi:diguanylate cyclase (GGDEF)-like protein/PAS domain S-box-containing protein
MRLHFHSDNVLFDLERQSSLRMMARSLALTWIAGGLVVVLASLVPETVFAESPNRNGPVLMAISGFAMIVGLALFRREHLSRWLIHTGLVAGTGAATLLIFTQRSNGYGLFYFWAVAYAVYFFRTAAATLHVAFIAACLAVAVLLVPAEGFSVTEWATIVLVLAVPLGAIATLRRSLIRTTELQHAILLATPDGLLVADATGRIRAINPALAGMFGYSVQQLLGEPVEKLLPARFHSGHPKLRAEFMRDGSARMMSSSRGIVGCHRDGREFPVVINLRTTQVGSTRFAIAAVRDNTEYEQVLETERTARAELEALRDELAALAATDELTSLFNRREFDAVVRRQMALADRTGCTFSCALVDIDHFKEINDTMGHVVGDAVLRRVANRLTAAMRKTDVVGRYGGDEFIVLFPDADAQDALVLAERLRGAVNAPVNLSPNLPPLQIRASFGISEYREEMRAPTDLYRAADIALYRAKSLGRDRVEAT